jgi:hypothetical protein
MSAQLHGDRRVLLIGAVTIVALVTLSHGVPSWRRWVSAERDSAAAIATEVARAESLVAARIVLRDSLSQRNARFLAMAPAILSGDSPAAAGAVLAGIVSGAASVSGMRMGAIQVQTSPSPGHERALTETRDATLGRRQQPVFVRVAVSAEATGDILGLTRLMRQLERGPAALAVRRISIAQPEPAAGDDRPEMLHVEMLVEGIALASRARAERRRGAEP